MRMPWTCDEELLRPRLAQKREACCSIPTAYASHHLLYHSASRFHAICRKLVLLHTGALVPPV